MDIELTIICHTFSQVLIWPRPQVDQNEHL